MSVDHSVAEVEDVSSESDLQVSDSESVTMALSESVSHHHITTTTLLERPASSGDLRVVWSKPPIQSLSRAQGSDDDDYNSPESNSDTDSDSEREDALRDKRSDLEENGKRTKRKLIPNLRRDQIVIVKEMKQNLFLNNTNLPSIPRPVEPQVSGKLNAAKMKQIQDFISAFDYNFLPEFFFDINKRKPFYKLMETCKEIVREALPIRCVEGTFLAIYLTQNFENIIRYPVSFRSCVGEVSYKHIVLCVQRGALFGALGMSRKPTLMYKALKFPSFSTLIQNFRESYEQIGHEVLGFTVGLPVPLHPHSKETIMWEFLQFSLRRHTWDEIGIILDLFSKDSIKLLEEVRSSAGLSSKNKRSYYGYMIPKYNKLAKSVAVDLVKKSMDVKESKENRDHKEHKEQKEQKEMKDRDHREGKDKEGNQKDRELKDTKERENREKENRKR